VGLILSEKLFHISLFVNFIDSVESEGSEI